MSALHQLAYVERLGQVVVAAEVEAALEVRLGVARREDEHRRAAPLGPQGLEDVQAAHEREHEVQDHEVVRVRPRHVQAVLAVGRDVDGVGDLLAQHLRHVPGQPRLVLDHQHPHRPPPAAPPLRRHDTTDRGRREHRSVFSVVIPSERSESRPGRAVVVLVFFLIAFHNGEKKLQ
jgi:hypothetical protein